MTTCTPFKHTFRHVQHTLMLQSQDIMSDVCKGMMYIMCMHIIVQWADVQISALVARALSQ